MTHTATVDVYRNLRLVGHVTVESAAHIYQLDADDIRWAIEEYGRCDTTSSDDDGRNIDIITLVVHGDPAPEAFHVGE